MQDEVKLEPWPLFGYAPGNYSISCYRCKAEAHDCDKRAITCLPCAVEQAKRHIAAIEATRPTAVTGQLEPQGGGWQPIETAPKDGTEFDAWAIWIGEDEAERVPDVAWGRGYIAFEIERGEFEGWIAQRWGIDGSTGAMDPEDQALTHWMPKPDPPSQSQEVGPVEGEGGRKKRRRAEARRHLAPAM